MNSSSFYCVLAFMLALIVIVQSGKKHRIDIGREMRNDIMLMDDSAVTPDESDEKRAHNIMRFGRGHSIMRFGRAGHNIMHFGKRGDGVSDESSLGYAAQGYGPADYQLPVDQSTLEALYVHAPQPKRTPQPFAPRLLLPHLFLTSFYHPPPARLTPSLTSLSPSALPLSRLSSYSPSYNKKASDPRELRERDNVFMHFG